MVIDTVGVTELAKVDILGSGKKFLKGRVKFGDRQHLENASPLLLIKIMVKEPTKYFLNQKTICVV
jgi:hypothetical protein